MLYILSFAIFAAFAILIISGLTEACADILRWAETRHQSDRNTDMVSFNYRQTATQKQNHSILA